MNRRQRPEVDELLRLWQARAGPSAVTTMIRRRHPDLKSAGPFARRQTAPERWSVVADDAAEDRYRLRRICRDISDIDRPGRLIGRRTDQPRPVEFDPDDLMAKPLVDRHAAEQFVLAAGPLIFRNRRRTPATACRFG